MLSDLSLEQKLVAQLMSDLSERCYYAGWLLNLEYVLWDAVLHGPRKFGIEIITQNDINDLKQLSNNCNCWIYFDEDKGETAIELHLWKEKFSAEYGSLT